MAVCIKCAAGRFAESTGWENCTACPKGWYVATTEKQECDECTAGKYTVQDGKTGCSLCSPGFISSTVRWNQACEECSPGKFAANESSSSCDPCAIGKLSSSKSPTCNLCQAGKFAANEASSSCDPCAAGRFRPSTSADASTCVDCPTGYYQDTDGQAACYPCLPGEFGNTTGLEACLKCAKGKVSENSSATMCEDCDAGQSSDSVGSASCTSCGAGTFSDVKGVACKGCAEGRYRLHNSDQPDENDPTSCGNCPSGYHQKIEGQASCLPCLPGKFADVSGLSECKECDPGKFQTAINSSACENVQEGYIAGVGASSEIKVALGFKAAGCDDTSSTGTRTCTATEPCPAGTYGEDPPSTECIKCPLGETSFGTSLNCNPCDKGKYGQIDSDDYAKCRDCPKGWYQDSAGKQVCINCPIGWQQINIGSQACVDMGANSPEDCAEKEEYLDRSTACAAGDFSCMKENYKCKPCPTGADCQRNSDHLNTNAKYGFWKADSALFIMNPDPGDVQNAVMQPCPYLKRCNNKAACAKGSANASDVNASSSNTTAATPQQQCCDGINTKYPLCAVCEVGWRKSSTGECVECGPSTQSTDTITVAVMLLVLIAAIAALNRLMKRYGHVIRIVWLDMLRVISIMINFTQISTSVTDTISVSWPDNFLLHLDVFRFVNLDFVDLTGFACNVTVTQKGKALFACVVITALVSMSILGLVTLNVKLKAQLSAFSKGKNTDKLKKMWEIALKKAFSLVDEDANGTLDVDELTQILKVTHTEASAQATAGSGNGGGGNAKPGAITNEAGPGAIPDTAGSKVGTAKASKIPDIKNWKMTSIVRADKLSNISFRRRSSTKSKNAHSLAEQLFIKWKGDVKAELSCVEFLRFMKSEALLSTTANMVALVRWERKSEITTSVLGTVGQMAFVLHAPISKTLFQWFNCRWVGDKAYVKMDFSTECGTPDYVATSVLVMSYILGFSVGLPVAVSTFMFVKRKKLHNAKTLATAGWLYNRYQHGVEWWEVHELSRKLILCSAIIFVPGQLRVPFAILISLLAMTSLNRFHPQKNGLVFKVALIAFTATCAKFISAVVVRAAVAEGDLKFRNQVGWYLVVQDILIYTFSFVAIILLTIFLVQKVKKARALEIRSDNRKKQSVIVPQPISIFPKPNIDQQTPSA